MTTISSGTACHPAHGIPDLARRWLAVSCWAIWSLAGLLPLHAAGWPTYRHDNARSGVTAAGLEFPLTECWVYQAAHAPRPAWGDPKPVPVEDLLELRRVHFDDVFQVVGANGCVYFGSSADHNVYCLDLLTGQVRWTYVTEGPIRLAPTWSDGRLYVGSDDGFIYCLGAEDGRLIWRLRAAPEDRRVLGQGKMISVWPPRTGVLVDGPTAYFGAGIFPTIGVALSAVEAATGQVVWRNDTAGEKPQSRVSPQGYLLASAARLYAPMGRVSPAAFDRRTGDLIYETSFGKQIGGSYALLAGEDVFTGTEELIGFRQATRDRFATFPGRRLVVTDQVYYVATNTELLALDRGDRSTRWRQRCGAADELILAGDTLIAAAGDQLTAVAVADGAIRWHATVKGTAKGLAVIDGRLLVSTDRGWIYCFGPPGAAPVGVVTQPVGEPDFGSGPAQEQLTAAAERILRETPIRRGYCLVWGCETGQLAARLARDTELMIYAVTPDAEKATAIRRTLHAAGLLGARVGVECHPLDALPYSDYFANLIVSETAVLTGRWPAAVHSGVRWLKPLGGTMLIGGPPVADEAPGSRTATAVERAVSGDARIAQLTRDGNWIKLVRGPLEGAGNWTHQYANVGNTACSDDTRVEAPLDVLWFGLPGPGDMVNRHQRAAAPLVYEDTLFVQGENVVMAYDIYNGLAVWKRELPGAMRVNASHDGGNLAVNEHGLMVAVKGTCLRLDRRTGEVLATYRAPVAGSFQRWGYIALDGDRLYGTRAAGAGASNGLFCFDVPSGRQMWLYEAAGILHNAIALGDGRIMLVQAAMTAQQRAIAASRAAQPPADQPLYRLVVALDAQTGKIQWQEPLDLTRCGPQVAAMYRRGVLALFGVFLDGHYWKEFFAGQFQSRPVTALDGATGRQLWSQPVGYRVRPLIVNDTLHAEPWAFDLRTGKQKTRINPITGVEEPWQFARPGHHCGCPAAAPNLLLFRSWNLGFYDLLRDDGITHFAGQRPGCWINFIPAGGLVVMPEASTGCMCDFPNHGTVVFQPATRQRAWAWYSAFGPVTPVKRLGMNLGAPGDRMDDGGDEWLGFPRPGGHLVLLDPIDVTFYAGGKFRQRNSTYLDLAGTDTDWLFASDAAGLRKLVVPVLSAGDGKARFLVRLLFHDPDNTAAGHRVFGIRLQGRPVAEGFDIVARAGGPDRVAVLETADVEVAEELTIELVAADPRAPLVALPLLSGVEIVRQEFTVPGCVVPSILVNNRQPQRQDQVALANLGAQPFRGMLRFQAPPELTVTPAEQAVQLPPGSRQAVPVSVAVTAGTVAGVYPVQVQLVRDDGTAVLQQVMPVEHLGPLARRILPAVADAHVSKRYPDRVQGAAGVLLIDGGNQQMNDADHAVAFLRFDLDLPGKPVSATLRIANAGNPTGDAGAVRLVEGSWDETKVTYNTRPALGPVLGHLGPLQPRQVAETKLDIDLAGRASLRVALDPTSTDGVDFLSREGGRAAELIVLYADQP